MKWFKSQSDSIQVRLGVGLLVLSGLLTALSPLFFFLVFPAGAYAIILGLRNRLKSRVIRVITVVPVALIVWGLIAAMATAAFNPDALNDDIPPSGITSSVTPSPAPSSSALETSPSPAPSSSALETSPSASPNVESETSEAQSSTNCQAGQVDINNASIDELMKIVHISTVRAPEVVALRPFSSIDELTDVSGIGDVRLAEIKSEGVACVG
jgi:DNA uptake protein ComE-like DNA-binding protein